VRVAIATFSAMPPEFTDDDRLAGALAELGVEVDRCPWDDQQVNWAAFDSVVIRSTWDYTPRRDEFVAWAESVGRRLHNAPPVVRWNSDKHYLADLATAGIPVVPTRYVEPGDPIPALVGDMVVKPTISVGAKDSGRFSARTQDRAVDLIEQIHANGRTAMLQPYLASVDTLGETAIVFLDGAPSHVLRKRAVLRPDEVAPVRDDAIGAAEVMYDPDLVVPGEATEPEFALAQTVHQHISERFGEVPLYARVDLVADHDGSPVLMEVELIEPNLYLDQVPDAAPRVAAAIIDRTRRLLTG
jgi:hypothetical protein